MGRWQRGAISTEEPASLHEHRIPVLVRPIAVRVELAIGPQKRLRRRECAEQRVMTGPGLMRPRQHGVDDA